MTMPFNHVKVPHRHQGTSRKKIRGAILLVAFEDCREGDVLVASHADIVLMMVSR